MTLQEFATKMREFSKLDPEDGHPKADDLMCEVLVELGYGEGVEVFEAMNKWYA